MRYALAISAVVMLAGGAAWADATNEAKRLAKDAFELRVFETAEDELNDRIDPDPDYFAGHRLIHREGPWGAVYLVPRSNDDTILPRTAKCVFVRLPTGNEPQSKFIFNDPLRGTVPKNGVANCPFNVDDATAKRLARRTGMPWK